MLTRSRSPAKGAPSQSFLAAEADDKENVKENMSPARERKGCLKTGAKQATLTTSPVTRSAMRRMQSPVCPTSLQIMLRALTAAMACHRCKRSQLRALTEKRRSASTCRSHA